MPFIRMYQITDLASPNVFPMAPMDLFSLVFFYFSLVMAYCTGNDNSLDVILTTTDSKWECNNKYLFI